MTNLLYRSRGRTIALGNSEDCWPYGIRNGQKVSLVLDACRWDYVGATVHR